MNHIYAYQEKSGARPAFYPGDVVRTKAGEIGVIVKAQTVIDGARCEWFYEAWPSVVRGAGVPSYALDAVPGFKRPGKCAWWTADEWEEVLLGPLHAEGGRAECFQAAATLRACAATLRKLLKERNPTPRRLAYRRLTDSEIVDYLASMWDSQGLGHVLMGRWMPNKSGAFRDAVTAHKKANR